jgi:hypothetical protein
MPPDARRLRSTRRLPVRAFSPQTRHSRSWTPATESVLRRARAAMELGRRTADDPALLTEVAALMRDPANRRLMTIGPASVSQLGAAGPVAAGAEPTTALTRELAAE